MSDTINGHEIDEHAWGRDTVVYMDHNRWDSSYEAAIQWAKGHAEPWQYVKPARSGSEGEA
jgi:hypothetical protein